MVTDGTTHLKMQQGKTLVIPEPTIRRHTKKNAAKKKLAMELKGRKAGDSKNGKRGS